MINKNLQVRFADLEKLAKAAGLDYFDVHFFEVPSHIIWQTAACGLPTRYSHWSFGAQYMHQQTQAEMGYSKIYELIIHNDPAIALLDSNNTEVVNLLIAAHCYAHSAFFKTNILFRRANETKMVDVATHHAAIIDQFRQDYGDDEVDEWLDIALSLERHIDFYRGFNRTRYPKRNVSYKNEKPDGYEFLDKSPKPMVKKVIEGLYVPPSQEKDILWFLSEYANLEPWQKKIFQIVRKESFYFFPMYRTQIANEGCASYFHAELMKQYALGNDNDYGVKLETQLSSEEHLDFVSYHEKVVQPGTKIPLKVEVEELDFNGKKRKIKVPNPIFQHHPNLWNSATRLNPYYVGFRILRDIKDRWDKYKEQGFYENEWGEKIPVLINGTQKILEVIREEDDVSLLSKYLTEDLASDLHLFVMSNSYGYKDDYNYQEKKSEKAKSFDRQYVNNNTIIVKSKELSKIKNYFAKKLANSRSPQIVVRRVDSDGLLRLEHLTNDDVNLDITYAKYVLKYMYSAWKRPVEIIRKDMIADKTWIMTYDGNQFDIDHEVIDYPDIVENEQSQSSL